DLLRAGRARDWGIVGAGVLAHDAVMRDALVAQDHLYTLTLKHPDGVKERRVIGSIIDYRFGPGDPQGLLALLTDPAIRLVSLTATEGGYHVPPVTREFASAHPLPAPAIPRVSPTVTEGGHNVHPVTGESVSDDPAIAADVAALRAGAAPATVFGYVVSALRHRREQGIAPFTVQSCDNISHNGRVAKQMFSAFARLVDERLAEWVDAHVAFPNSMVDRITPATTDDDRAELRSDTGVVDAWPVVAEPFFQWVLEDAFTAGRPPYEEAGVQLVDDVRPYEHMKLRL